MLDYVLATTAIASPNTTRHLWLLYVFTQSKLKSPPTPPPSISNSSPASPVNPICPKCTVPAIQVPKLHFEGNHLKPGTYTTIADVEKYFGELPPPEPAPPPGRMFPLDELQVVRVQKSGSKTFWHLVEFTDWLWLVGCGSEIVLPLILDDRACRPLDECPLS